MSLTDNIAKAGWVGYT